MTLIILNQIICINTSIVHIMVIVLPCALFECTSSILGAIGDKNAYRKLLFIRVEIFLSSAKMPKFFHRKFYLTKNYETWKMANNFNLLRSLHLLLSTSFCLHVSLKWNINFVHEISHVKYKAFRKFLGQTIFVRKRINENFSQIIWN